MRRFDRGPAPEWLLQRCEGWGIRWEAALKEKAQFRWPTLEGEPVNRKLLPVLKRQVQDHCSFCDGYPISPPGLETVEHFRPKSTFPLEAYRWENLYYCCNFCQAKKGETYEECILRPDDGDYAFRRYFWFDYTTGTIEVNRKADPQDQLRAEATLRLYGLNDDHPRWRRMSAHRWLLDPDKKLELFPYRDFISAQPTTGPRHP